MVGCFIVGMDEWISRVFPHPRDTVREKRLTGFNLTKGQVRCFGHKPDIFKCIKKSL